MQEEDRVRGIAVAAPSETPSQLPVSKADPEDYEDEENSIFDASPLRIRGGK